MSQSGQEESLVASKVSGLASSLDSIRTHSGKHLAPAVYAHGRPIVASRASQNAGVW